MVDTEPILRLAQQLADRINEQAADDTTGFDGFPRQIMMLVESAGRVP